MAGIDDIFMPCDATKDQLVMVVFHDQLSVVELDQMAKALINSLRSAGFYEQALTFGYVSTTSTLSIFVKVPVLDVFNHLHSC